MSDESDLSGLSMQELFRMEVESQGAVLTDGLLALEHDPGSAESLELLMRASHSIKGAARIVNLDPAVDVAHAMEDCFVAAQTGELLLGASHVDLFLVGVDMLNRMSLVTEDGQDAWFSEHKAEIDGLLEDLSCALRGESNAKTRKGAPAKAEKDTAGKTKEEATEERTGGRASEPETAGTPGFEAASDAGQPADGASAQAPPSAAKAPRKEQKDGVLKISPEQIDQLLGLAGEVQMQWQWLRPFADSLLILKRRIAELESILGSAESSPATAEDGHGSQQIKDAKAKAATCSGILSDRLTELESHDRAVFRLSQRLYHQTVSSRMQPFADGVHGFKRMVRDVARGLGKEVRLEILGADTLIDRDILEKMEAPLTHLLRNAVDHGIEMPEQRRCQGKSPAGVITLAARHHAGMLKITVSDDGGGIDLAALGRTVVERDLATAEMVDQMSEVELTAFLFLPRFTMKETVSEISGRGVGLDVVATAVSEVRGTVHTTSSPGLGTQIELQLPNTLSVMRSMLVEIAGEPYAFPLAHIKRALRLEGDSIEQVEGRQYISVDGQHVGLVSARQVLGLQGAPSATGGLHVVVLGDRGGRYGLIVDGFHGECDLIEKRLDRRLGKVKDIAAGAMMTDGAPLLIIDVNDVVRSIEKLITGGRLSRADRALKGTGEAVKRILVVDDSITVREVERKLLSSNGYAVEVAVDGVDGWNSVRAGEFDLVVSDVDMPRMDGIDLVRHIKSDPRLRAIPVVIVSYKESDEDRMRGLEAGADAYLAKSSFHDETLLEVVRDLIGVA